MKNTQKGFIVPIASTIVIIVLVLGGVYVYKKGNQKSIPSIESTTGIINENEQHTAEYKASDDTVLTLFSPKTGDVWSKGDSSKSILWQYPLDMKGHEIWMEVSFKPIISKKNPESESETFSEYYSTFTVPNDSNLGKMNWDVFRNMNLGPGDFQIILNMTDHVTHKGYTANTIFSISSSSTITTPVIPTIITSPVSGSSYESGQNLDITWKGYTHDSDICELSLMGPVSDNKDIINELVTIIHIQGLPCAKESFSWKIKDPSIRPGYKYRIGLITPYNRNASNGPLIFIATTTNVINLGGGFKISNGVVYSRGNANNDIEVLGADPETFELIEGGSWAKDKNNFYLGSNVVPDVDYKTFTFIDDGKDNRAYTKDKSHVWYYGKLIHGADAGSFVVDKTTWDPSYAKDKNHVFYREDVLNLEIDPASFQVLVDRNYGVLKDKSHVYFGYYDYLLQLERYRLATTTDAQSFQYLGVCGSFEKSSSSYFKDKYHVFVDSKILDYIDISSFEFMGSFESKDSLPSSLAYAKDKNAVYYSCGAVLKNADPSTFVPLKDTYAKDKSHVWYDGELILGADANTFQSLGDGYAKDASHIYFTNRILTDIDVSSFTIVENEKSDDFSPTRRIYLKDKNHVYDASDNFKIIRGIKPEDCTMETFAKCSTNVFTP